MTRVFVSLLILSLVSLALCDSSENAIYFGGNFVQTYQDSQGNLHHASSLLTYNLDTMLEDDDFNGVYVENDAISNLYATSGGNIFASGPFNFANFEYSNTIAQLDEHGDWTTVLDGIWCHNCVNLISSVNQYVFFAGDFTTIESLPNVTLPGIVLYNTELDLFRALSNPNNVFPANADIQGLAGSEADGNLYIYEANTNGLYFYDVSAADFVLVSNNFHWKVLNETLVVAENGDIYMFAYNIDYQYSTIAQSAYYWPVNYTIGQAPHNIEIKKIPYAYVLCSPAIMTPYRSGVLIANPDPNAVPECAAMFEYLEAGAHKGLNIPPSTDPVSSIIAGANNELWAMLTSDGNSVLCYWNTSYTYWVIVSLREIGITDYNVVSLTYDQSRSALFAYLLVFGNGTSDYRLVHVRSDLLQPVLDQPGVLSASGYVTGFAFDSSNNVLFVGGTFSAISSKPATNFAYYSFNDDEWVSLSTGRIRGLSNIGSDVYIIYTSCGNTEDLIPFNGYSIDDQNLDVKENLPMFADDGGCLYTISTNSTHVYIGGEFVLQLANTQLAYGVVIYNVAADEWTTIPINSSIANQNYQIRSIEEFTYNSVSYLAIAGVFDFTARLNQNNGIRYINLALYDISNQQWVQISPSGMSAIYSVVYMYDGVFLLGGNTVGSASEASVMSYNISSSSYSSLAGLKSRVFSLLLYTVNDANNNPLYTTIYAGGESATGVAATNYTSGTWVDIGSVYDNMFDGYVEVLSYSTGGNGAGGQNGDNPPSGGSSDWWWITLIVIGSVLLVVAVIGVVAVGGAVYYQQRKKSLYSALN